MSPQIINTLGKTQIVIFGVAMDTVTGMAAIVVVTELTAAPVVSLTLIHILATPLIWQQSVSLTTKTC